MEVEATSAAGVALEPVHAPCAVITLPLGVLQAPAGSPGAVRFLPDLPQKRAA